MGLTISLQPSVMFICYLFWFTTNKGDKQLEQRVCWDCSCLASKCTCLLLNIHCSFWICQDCWHGGLLFAISQLATLLCASDLSEKAWCQINHSEIHRRVRVCILFLTNFPPNTKSTSSNENIDCGKIFV